MRLTANTAVGQLVNNLLVSRYNLRFPEAPLVPREFTSLFDLMTGYRNQIDILYNPAKLGFAGTAGLVAMRAMQRGLAVNHDILDKSMWTLIDTQRILQANGLTAIEREVDGEGLKAELDGLYGQNCLMGDEWGALGGLLYEFCQDQMKGTEFPRTVTRPLWRDIRAAARRCDTAQTLAEQRVRVGDLLEELRRHLLRHTGEGLDDVILSAWDWMTSMLYQSDLWRELGETE